MKVWIESCFDNLPFEGFRKQRFWLMAEAFRAEGHEVTYWTADFNHGTKRRRALDVAAAKASGIDLRLVYAPPYPRNVCIRRIFSHRRYVRNWRKLALAEAERPDVIIASMPTIGSAETAIALARHFGARAVVDVMDAWPETFERLLPRGCKWLGAVLLAGMRRRARRVYREADLITGVCERYRELTGRSDYLLAYHGIEAGDAKRAERPVHSPLRLVYAGNLGSGYDLAPVVRAVNANADLTLDIAGKGPREAELRAMAEGRVKFHGYLGAEELSRLVGEADIGVIPMRDDSWVGLPYKLGDYVKANLRIISSLNGETGEMLRRHQCGATYEGGDDASCLKAIRRAATMHGSAGMLAELDAANIYREYVRRVLAK